MLSSTPLVVLAVVVIAVALSTPRIAEAACTVPANPTCTTCPGDCKKCGVGSKYFTCQVAACEPTLTALGTCLAQGHATIVTSSVECPNKLCKSKALPLHVCVPKPDPDQTCDKLDGGLVEPTACTNPETFGSCEACGRAWCKVCKLADAGFMCTSDATCPIGVELTDKCTDLTKVTSKASGDCDAGTTTCYKGTIKYCVAAATADCTKFTLSAKPTDEGNGGNDAKCTAKKCEECRTTTGCQICKAGTVSVCLPTSPTVCTDPKTKVSAVVTTCDGIKATAVPGSDCTGYNKCKQNGMEVCLVEQCKDVGFESGASMATMTGLLGLVLAGAYLI